MRPITNEDELNLLKPQETNQSVNSDKPPQPSQQDTLSSPNQPFEFTINDKQPNTLTEQNLVSKQQFETRDNQNLEHSPGNALSISEFLITVSMITNANICSHTISRL
jgi:hypothetical protein